MGKFQTSRSTAAMRPYLAGSNQVFTILALFLLSFFAGCDTSDRPPQQVDPAKYKEPLMKANHQLVEMEEQDIANFVKRNNWKMNHTGSGLQYMIYENGNGIRVETGKVVRCAYRTSLLTGKVCYNSDEKGPLEFLVGRGGVESGLEEVMLLLREGDKVKIILPSHLAFGLLGDEDCIPRKAVVVYDLEVMNVLNPITEN